MRVLLFDLDDTLVPSSKSYDVAMQVIGVDPSDPLYLQARSEVKTACPKGYPASRSRRLYFKRFLELQGEFSPRRYLELVTGYEAKVASYLGQAWQELERPRLFSQLTDKVDKIGLVSNETTFMQSAKLSQMDPEWNHFDFILTSEEVGCEKPDLRIFQRALDIVKATSGECLCVGDNFACDIAAPISLGMRAIQTLEFFQDVSRHHETVFKLDELTQAF